MAGTHPTRNPSAGVPPLLSPLWARSPEEGALRLSPRPGVPTGQGSLLAHRREGPHAGCRQVHGPVTRSANEQTGTNAELEPPKSPVNKVNKGQVDASSWEIQTLLRWIEGLNIRAKAIKLSEGNRAGCLHDLERQRSLKQGTESEKH